MKKQPTIVVLDCGSLHTQDVARRVRETRVYSEVVDASISADELQRFNLAGLILSGGATEETTVGEPTVIDPRIFDLGYPVLALGTAADLLPRGTAVCTADDAAAAAGLAVVGKGERRIYRALFAPEVINTPAARPALRHFARQACACRALWTPRAYVKQTVEELRCQVGDAHVVCGLSGGVDSAVTAVLLHKAIGDQLTCIFVDNGLMRLNEGDQLMKMFEEQLHMRIRRVDAAQHFLQHLAGVSDPEAKRKIIGHEFITIFKQEAQSLPNARFLAQGTLYPDILESLGIGKHGQVIKSHHNVGGLPEELGFELVEPLKMLYKDEVRAIGKEMGMDKAMLWRQPFPGPGLAVRCLGEITREKLDILRAADAILIEEVRAAGWYRRIWQSFAVLLPIRSVGMKGVERSYDYTCVIRAVQSADGMAANWVRLPHKLVARISERITDEVAGINRVVLDVTSKPPSTIEWE